MLQQRELASLSGTIRASSLIGYPELARSVGLDPLRMLDAVAIPREALADPDLPISATALRDLLELCSHSAEDFGLRLMERRPLSVLGPLLLVVREQPTVRSALGAIQRFASVHHQAPHLDLEEVDDVAIIRLVVSYPRPGPSRQVAESTLYQRIRLLRIFLGANWRPRTTTFIHGPPVSLATHHRIFGQDIRFDQDCHSIIIDRRELDAENQSSDPEMARQIEHYVTGLKGAADEDFRAQALRVIHELLPTGRCSIGAAAGRLGIDPRMMQRRLAVLDTTFMDLVTEARLSLAVQYLDESNRPLVEVAELLGFSALSAFSRWHREHCGQPPSDRRAERMRVG